MRQVFPNFGPKYFPVCVVCHHGAGEDSVNKAEYEPDKMKSNQEDRAGSFHKNENKKQRNWFLSMKCLNSIELVQ